MVQFRAESIKDLANIINHFDKYPLLTKNFWDYTLFKKAYYIVLNKEHLTTEGLKIFVQIKTSKNKGLSKSLNLAFPNIVIIDKLLTTESKVSDPNWIAVFASGPYFNLFKLKNNTNLNPTNSSFYLLTGLLKFLKSIRSFSTNSSNTNNINLSLVLWGTNLTSQIGTGRFTKQVSEMFKLPPYQESVIVGLIISDAWLKFSSKISTNVYLGFEQSLDNSGYFFIFVFYIISLLLC